MCTVVQFNVVVNPSRSAVTLPVTASKLPPQTAVTRSVHPFSSPKFRVTLSGYTSWPFSSPNLPSYSPTAHSLALSNPESPSVSWAVRCVGDAAQPNPDIMNPIYCAVVIYFIVTILLQCMPKMISKTCTRNNLWKNVQNSEVTDL